MPVLGTIGFAATGPVAGSTAAAWRASIGLVEAGSLFAWCQSATMGGAALSGIVLSGVAGAGIAGAATVPVNEGWKGRFSWVFKKGNGLLEGDSAEEKAQRDSTAEKNPRAF